ncbi:MAG: hypothetical protein WC868_06700 [Bacteroidales bacterium]
MEINDDIQNDKLKESAPNLFSMKKENSFNVPDGYFENLSNEISEKCFQSNNKKPAPIINNTLQKILIPVAIAATIIIIILIFFKENMNEINTTTQYVYIDINSMSEYLENLIDNNELDESLIVSELINDDTIKSDLQKHQANICKTTNPVIIKDSLNNNTITKDDIIQYLLENDESDDLLN